MNYKCKCCKNDDPGLFVHDCRTADIICRECGIIQTHMNNSDGNTTFCEPIEIRPITASERKFLKINDQMMAKVCPEEVRDFKKNKLLKEFCEKLDLNKAVETRAKLLFEKHKEELCCLRPVENLVAASICVACQSLKRYINVVDIENLLMLSNVNKTLKSLCQIIGINQRAMILNAVPYFVNCIGLPFKFEKKLRELYMTVCKKNPSMGAETRMALCCYKLYLENESKSLFKGRIKLSDIADITKTSENSLKTYVNGKTNNYLFKRSRDDISVDKEQSKRLKVQ